MSADNTNKIINVNSIKGSEILEQLNLEFDGHLESNWGENTLKFENTIGKGTVRHIDFDWGVSLIDWNVRLEEDLEIIFKSNLASPIEFIFISEGAIKFSSNGHKDFISLERYQNIIISPEKKARRRYILAKDTNIRVNFIRVLRKEYFKKRNNNLTYLNEILQSVFNDRDGKLPYNHMGSYNLKIADQVKALNNVADSGIIRSLSVEGRLYLILAMQLMEHHNFENNEVLPDSLSKADIKKIHELSGFIVDYTADDLSVSRLSSISGLSPKKLQMGFRLLYSKSVNEYVRHIKLEIARDQLKSTDLSVSEIVYKIGFKSRSYFSKIFYEKYKILPTEYRNTLKRRV